MCKEQTFQWHFWWPFHSLLPCYHMGILFPAAAVQNSALSSRPRTPTSTVLEDEIICFLTEKIKIIRQELLHFPSPTYSNTFPHPYWLLWSRRGQFLPKEWHLVLDPGTSSPLAPWAINDPCTSLVLSLSTGSSPLVLKHRIKYTASYKWTSKKNKVFSMTTFPHFWSPTCYSLCPTTSLLKRGSLCLNQTVSSLSSWFCPRQSIKNLLVVFRIP